MYLFCSKIIIIKICSSLYINYAIKIARSIIISVAIVSIGVLPRPGKQHNFRVEKLIVTALR